MLLKSMRRNVSLLLLVGTMFIEDSLFARTAMQEEPEQITSLAESKYPYLTKDELKNRGIKVYGDSHPKLLNLGSMKDWQILTQSDVNEICNAQGTSLEDRLRALNWLRNKRYQKEDIDNQYIHNISNLARLLL